MPVSLGVLLVTPSQRMPEPRPASGTLARPGTGRPGRRPAEDRQIPPAQRCASPPARPNVAGHVLPARMPATARSAAPSSARSSTTRSARCSPAGGASQSCADSPHQSNAWRSALAHSHVSVHLELRDHLRSSGSQGLCGVDISFDHSNISEDNEISGEPVRERDGGSESSRRANLPGQGHVPILKHRPGALRGAIGTAFRAIAVQPDDSLLDRPPVW